VAPLGALAWPAGPDSLSALTSPPGDPTVYDVLVGLHVATALIGFGSVGLSGVYGGSARSPDPGRREEAARFFQGALRAQYLILVVPFLGAAALWFRPGGHDYSATWVLIGAVVWLLASALLLGVVRPAEDCLRRSLGPPSSPGSPPVAAADHEPAWSGTRLLWASVATDVLFVVALAVMVTQPV